MKTRIVVVILATLLAVRVFLAATAPVFDTSEARYAAISANMARTGDFLVPRFTYDGRYQSFDGKPPLQFQLSALACRAFGTSEFAVRLPDILASVAALALLFACVAALAGRERALLAVGIASTCVAFYALAGCCMPDGILTVSVAAAYFCHVLYLKTERRAWSLGVFVALALGMLAKGPVALALFGLPVVAEGIVNRRRREFLRYGWVLGIPIFLAIAAPWFILMERENSGFLSYFFVNENVKRFLVHDYGDKYGAGREFFRGVALVWALVVTLPWSPLVLGRLLREKASVGRLARLSALFRGEAAPFAFGAVGIVAFWCLTSRVPLAYLMPVVPLFAAIAAIATPKETLARSFHWTAGAVALVLSGILLGGRFLSDKMRGADAPYQRNRYSYEFYHGTPDTTKEARP